MRRPTWTQLQDAAAIVRFAYHPSASTGAELSDSGCGARRLGRRRSLSQRTPRRERLGFVAQSGPRFL